MAYFAKIVNNIVTDVIVADQSFVDTQEGTWVETDINGISPKNYAAIGDTYDGVNGAFIAPQPFPSWSLDSNFRWQAPVVRPDDTGDYKWDEAQQNWILR